MKQSLRPKSILPSVIALPILIILALVLGRIIGTLSAWSYLGVF